MPGVDFRFAWAFIDMMSSDDLAAARAAGERVQDARLSVFHDPEHRLGRTIARCLGWKHHVAWDTYLLYAPGRTWPGEELPVPDEWFHQLKDREMWEETADADLGSKTWTEHLPEKSEADPARFRTGDDLRTAMEEAVLRLEAARASRAAAG